MKITLNEALALQNTITEIMSSTSLTNVKFIYALNKNKKTLVNITESVETTLKTIPEEINAYNKDRMELAKFHAKKDKDGKPITENVNGQTNYVVENMAKFDEAFKKLQISHKVAVAMIETRSKEIDDLLKTEAEIDIHSIDINSFPEKLPAHVASILIQYLVSEDIEKIKPIEIKK